MPGPIAHHAANSLIFARPARGSHPTPTPLAYDVATPGKGLGTRDVAVADKVTLVELPVTKS